MVLKIVTAPNPALSSITKPVNGINAGVIKIINQMKEALNKASDPVGVGLAAPQIGKPLRIFIAKPTDKSEILVFINPKITTNKQLPTTNIRKLEVAHLPVNSSAGEVGRNSQKSKGSKLEGCLSLPTIWGSVLRTPSLTLTFLDEKGVPHKQKFSNFLAIIIQHEMDHLDGVLFPKRVLEQKGTLYKSHKNKKGEDEFEEIEI